MWPSLELVQRMVFVSGLVYLGLAAGSLAVPWLVNWPAELARLNRLTRQVFWVYGAYILASHVCFGLLSLLAPAALAGGTLLAAAVAAFIALWWAARLLIQFCLLDRRAVPPQAVYRFGEMALVCVFVVLTVIYSLAAWTNWRMLWT